MNIRSASFSVCGKMANNIGTLNINCISRTIYRDTPLPVCIQKLVIPDDDRFQPLLLEPYDLPAQLPEKVVGHAEQQVLDCQDQHEKCRPLGNLQQAVFLFQLLDFFGNDGHILLCQLLACRVLPKRILVGNAGDHFVAIHDVDVIFAVERIDRIFVQLAVFPDLQDDVVDARCTVEG